MDQSIDPSVYLCVWLFEFIHIVIELFHFLTYFLRFVEEKIYWYLSDCAARRLIT